MIRMGVLSVVLFALAGFLASCGDSGSSDELTLSVIGFTGEGIEQADSVGQTHAEVDVCVNLCDEEEVEPFTQTSVNVIFLNRGKSDILLDQYTIHVPGSGIPEIRRPVSAVIPGGRCSTDPSVNCVDDLECFSVGGSCIHSETRVSVLLYDFDFKDKVILGQCIDPVTELPGVVIPQTLQAVLTFSGRDATNYFTVSANYLSTFTDFDNCDQN